MVLLGSGLVVGSEVVDEDVVVPVTVAHVEVVHLRGKVGEGRARCSSHAVASSSLEAFSKDRDLLAKLAGFKSVVAHKLLLVELELVDHVVHLHGLAVPVLLLSNELVVLNAHGSEVLLHAAHLLDPALLLFLELFGVLLLALTGVETAIR